MTRRALTTFLAFGLAAGACSTSDSTPPTATAAPSSSTTTTVVATELPRFDGLSFDEFLAASYEALARRSPQDVVSLAIGYDVGPVVDNLSPAYLDMTHALETQVLDALRSYDRAALAADEQTSYDVYEWHLDERVRRQRFAYHDFPVSFFITSYNARTLRFFIEEHPLGTREDADDYILRVAQLKTQVDQLIEGLEIRRQLGIAPPDYVIEWTLGTLRADLAGSASSAAAPRAEALPIYTSFVERTQHLELSSEDRARLNGEAERAVRDGFAPAWQALIAYMETVEPRSDVGLWSLPDGDEYYAHLLGFHTTTNMTAQEIHELGLEQVDRVLAEMRAIFDELGYPAQDSLGQIRVRVRAQGGWLDGDTPEREAEVLAYHDELIAEATERSRAYFSRIPDAELKIVPEPIGQGGFYIPGAADGSRPGAYHAGIQGLALPRYTVPTIVHHETTPGHHFQISLAQEMDLPDVRRFTLFTGYTEGWALYAERLAQEMGLYEDDVFGDLGRLELELLRAVRLVVDTGIHSMGWTREQARTYMVDAMDDDSWVREVERYVSYPGQATAYMIGQQTILDLRADAQAALGEDFDIVVFHDLVVGSGALPLGVLERVIEDWISS